MKYRNFELRIVPLVEGRFCATVTESIHGRGSCEFTVPSEIEDYRIPQAGNEPRVSRELAPIEPSLVALARPGAPSPEEAGRLLFDTVFSGTVGELFRKCHDPAWGLKIILVLQDGGGEGLCLHALPWELLFYERHLAVNATYSIVRQMDGPAPPEDVFTASGEQLRVLVVCANPNDTSPLALEREQGILAGMQGTAGVAFVPLQDVSRRGLHEALEQGFHAVHFMGHGDWVQGQPVLFLLDEYGDAEAVTGAELAEELRGLTSAQWPSLFVLNACHGGAVALGARGLTGIAAELHRAGLPAVVAMRREIGDDAAVTFSRTFYKAVANHLTLDEAMAKARLALKRESDLALDWATPCLFCNRSGSRPSASKSGSEPKQKQPGRPDIRPLSRRLGLAAVLLLFTFLAIYWFFLQENEIRLAVGPINGDIRNEFGWVQLQIKQDLTGLEGVTVVEGQAEVDIHLGINAETTPATLEVALMRATKPERKFSLSLPAESDEDELYALRGALRTRLLGALGLTATDPGSIPKVAAQNFEHNNRGLKLVAERDFAGAEEAFRKALEGDPDYAAVHTNLAMTLKEQVRFSEALPHARRAAELGPGLPLFHYNLGVVLSALQRYEEALLAFDEALERDPYYVDALYGSGRVLEEGQKWNKARKRFEKVTRVDPTRVGAWMGLGRVLQTNGELEKAQSCWAEALVLTAGETGLVRAEILYHMAWGLSSLGRSALAQEKLEAFAALPIPRDAIWSHKASELAETLGAELMPMAAKDYWPEELPAGPFAFFTEVEGLVRLFETGELLVTAKNDSALKQGWQIEADPGARAILACRHEKVFVLGGPASMVAEDNLCARQGGEPSRLYRLMIQNLDRVSSQYGDLLTSGTRPGSSEGYAILAPLGKTVSLKPELAWTSFTDADTYDITIVTETRGSRTRTVETAALEQFSITIGYETRALLRYAWPDEALQPGDSFEIRISPVFSDSFAIEEMRVSVDVLPSADSYELNRLMDEIDARIAANPARLRLRGDAYMNAGLWAEALQSQLELTASGALPEDEVTLGKIFMEAGLTAFARPVFCNLQCQNIDPLARAAVEEGLGRIGFGEGDQKKARIHLGRARAIFASAGMIAELERVESALEQFSGGIEDD